MNKELRGQAIELRTKKRMSYSAIMRTLGVSKSTLSYWLRDYPLTEDEILQLRRKGWQKGEASRERYRNTMRKKKEERAESVYATEKEELENITAETKFVAGLVLYAAEGAKRDPYRIALANTDPNLLMFFKKWLMEFYEVPEAKIRSQLHLYKNMNIGKEKRFWQQTLELRKEQFYKTQVRTLQKNSFLYGGSFRHGTATIEISSGEVKTRIMMGIKAFLDLHTK